MPFLQPAVPTTTVRASTASGRAVTKFLSRAVLGGRDALTFGCCERGSEMPAPRAGTRLPADSAKVVIGYTGHIDAADCAATGRSCRQPSIAEVQWPTSEMKVHSQPNANPI